MTQRYKIPVSVLVLIHTPELDVLLLERADRPGFWQSVTGSIEHAGEALPATVEREVREETGLDAGAYRVTDWQRENRYRIYPRWRRRYAPGIVRNAEHVFSMEVPGRLPVRLAPQEHLAYEWLPWQAAVERVFSWTNADAIRELPLRRSALTA
jgi:dATP pyrophosphohydrolase